MRPKARACKDRGTYNWIERSYWQHQRPAGRVYAGCFLSSLYMPWAKTLLMFGWQSLICKKVSDTKNELYWAYAGTRRRNINQHVWHMEQWQHVPALRLLKVLHSADQSIRNGWNSGGSSLLSRCSIRVDQDGAPIWLVDPPWPIAVIEPSIILKAWVLQVQHDSRCRCLEMMRLHTLLSVSFAVFWSRSSSFAVSYFRADFGALEAGGKVPLCMRPCEPWWAMQRYWWSLSCLIFMIL